MVTREKLEEVKARLEGGERVLRLQAGKTSIRFIPFEKDPALDAGIFEMWLGHWTPQGFVACARTYKEFECPVCGLFKKYAGTKVEAVKNRLYRMRAKPVFISYVSQNEKPDNTGAWLPPKLYIVSKSAASTIIDKFLNIVDGDFYPPDGNPSYALIITKKVADPNYPPDISYDLSRKAYEIPKFKVNPLKGELLNKAEVERIADEISRFIEEQLYFQGATTTAVEHEIEEEVNNVLEDWDA